MVHRALSHALDTHDKRTADEAEPGVFRAIGTENGLSGEYCGLSGTKLGFDETV